MGKKKSAAPVATPVPESPSQPKQKKAKSKTTPVPKIKKEDTKRKPSIKRATNEEELFDFKSSVAKAKKMHPGVLSPPTQMDAPNASAEVGDCLVSDDAMTELVDLLTETKPGRVPPQPAPKKTTTKPEQNKKKSRSKPKNPKQQNSVVDDRAHAVLFGVCVEEEEPSSSRQVPCCGADDMVATITLVIGLGLIGWGVYQMYQGMKLVHAEEVAKAVAPK